MERIATVPAYDMSAAKAVAIVQPSMPEVMSGAQGAVVVDQPNIPSPDPIGDVNVQIPEYSYLESITAGFQTTAINAAYDYWSRPDFVATPGYDAALQMEVDQRDFGIHRTEAQKEHLLRSRSAAEYEWRTTVLVEEANDAKRIQQNMGVSLIGMVADADIAVGYGLTKVPALNQLSKLSRVTTNAAINGAVTGAALTAGNQVRPMTTADMITYTVAVTAGAMLGEALRTTNKVLPEPEPVPPTIITE